MERVTFVSTYTADSAHPIHKEVMTDGRPSRADLLVWMPVAIPRTLSWFNASREPVASLLDRIASSETYWLASGNSGTYAIIDQPAFELDQRLIEGLVNCRLLILPPVTFCSNGTVRFDVVGQTDSLREFYQVITEITETDIDRVTTYCGDPVTTSATGRQRTALEVGLEVGYYAVPRSGSVTDVAESLGCARSTASELLRKGEAAILEDVLCTP